MTDQEKKRHIEIKTAKENAVKTNTPIDYPQKYQPAMFFSERDNRWIKGVIVGIVGNKVLFANSLDTSSWKSLPNYGKGWLFKLPDNEISKYEAPEWKNAVDVILQNTQANKEFRSQRRQMRKSMRGFF